MDTADHCFFLLTVTYSLLAVVSLLIQDSAKKSSSEVDLTTTKKSSKSGTGDLRQSDNNGVMEKSVSRDQKNAANKSPMTQSESDASSSAPVITDRIESGFASLSVTSDTAASSSHSAAKTVTQPSQIGKLTDDNVTNRQFVLNDSAANATQLRLGTTSSFAAGKASSAGVGSVAGIVRDGTVGNSGSASLPADRSFVVTTADSSADSLLKREAESFVAQWTGNNTDNTKLSTARSQQQSVPSTQPALDVTTPILCHDQWFYRDPQGDIQG